MSTLELAAVDIPDIPYSKRNINSYTKKDIENVIRDSGEELNSIKQIGDNSNIFRQIYTSYYKTISGTAKRLGYDDLVEQLNGIMKKIN